MQRRYPFFTNQTPSAYDMLTKIFLDVIRLAAQSNKCEWEVRLSRKDLERSCRRKALVDVLATHRLFREDEDKISLKLVIADMGQMNLTLPRREQDLIDIDRFTASPSNIKMSCTSERLTETLLFRDGICPVCKVKRKLMKCGRCTAIAYCSSECQIADWSAHKIECKPFSLSSLVDLGRPEEK